MSAARTIPFGVVLLWSVFPGRADAHHSFRMHYDPDRSIELQGVVAEVDLRSPHSFFFVDAPGEDGVIQRWEVEAASLVHLRRLGIHPDTFQPGDSITIDAWPNLVPNNPLIWGQAFTAADGTRYGGPPTADRADPGTQPTGGVERLAGRWMAPPPNAQPESPLPLNEAGWDAWRNYDPQLSPANTCEPIGMPGILYASYLNSIEVREGEVFLHHEVFDITRTVPLNGESRQAEPTGVLGTVSGRIEGDALVVESSGYPASAWGLAIAVGTNGSGADVPSSVQKTVVERYSIGEDDTRLVVEVSFEDPVYMREPYSDRLEFSRVSKDTPWYDYVCEVDSAERFSRDP